MQGERFPLHWFLLLFVAGLFYLLGGLMVAIIASLVFLALDIIVSVVIGRLPGK